MHAGEALPGRGVRCRPGRTRMPGGGWGANPPGNPIVSRALPDYVVDRVLRREPHIVMTYAEL
jgi:hypothetical protein